MISGQNDKTESELLALEEYILEHISPEPPLLKKLYRDAHTHLVRPRMMSGHHQGRLLALLSKLKSPRNVIEIGTYTGYATLCLAEGLSEKGIVHTIELNDEMEDFLRRYFDQSEQKEQIRLYFGDALEILPTLPLEETDIVYIDANKRHYIEYVKLVLKRLPAGSLIISDNTLWDGKVIEPEAQDEQTVSIRNFNDYLLEQPELSTVILPLRDGLTLSIKQTDTRQ